MAPPIRENIVSSSSVVSNDKRDRIQNQVKLNKEFKKLESRLHDTILNYKDCISWNGEPGRTNLGKTEICTGGGKPIFVPPSRLSPDVAELLKNKSKNG